MRSLLVIAMACAGWACRSTPDHVSMPQASEPAKLAPAEVLTRAGALLPEYLPGSFGTEQVDALVRAHEHWQQGLYPQALLGLREVEAQCTKPSLQRQLQFACARVVQALEGSSVARGLYLALAAGGSDVAGRAALAQLGAIELSSGDPALAKICLDQAVQGDLPPAWRWQALGNRALAAAVLQPTLENLAALEPLAQELERAGLAEEAAALRRNRVRLAPLQPTKS